ncbi:hypothetical protein EV421DRAFT_2043356 [Armillaria borealis]|uniref:Uncharacterized protein n=1 Tax=Armillaria borealis TaxID=47425 RepID=A0AA39M4W8_9AGAR|nr:hypothetical protein EV421DRAFT_2043356 [Armillaria borealis]
MTPTRPETHAGPGYGSAGYGSGSASWHPWVTHGHACPDDSWNGSIMSSLHFGQDQSQTSTQDSMFSINLNDNPEAQVEQTDEPNSEYVHQTSSQRVRVSSNDIEAQQEEVKIDHEATPGPIVQG